MNLEIMGHIHEAYQKRLNCQFEGAMDSLAMIESSLKSNVGSEDSLSRDDLISLYALRASLSRRTEGLEKSQKYLDAIIEEVKKNHAESFFFQMEQGLNYFAQAQYSLALNYFLQARLVSGENYPWQKRWALINILLCKENVGLPFKDSLKILNDESPCDQKDIENQIKAFSLRQSFKNAELEELFVSSVQVGTSFSQAEYYRLWIRSLPYHSYYQGSIEEDVIEKLYVDQALYCGSFRAHTLIYSFLDLDFQKTVKGTDLVDRFYLWTWRWMIGQKQEDFDKIIRLVSKLNIETLLEGLTVEDKVLLKNALSWIRLFIHQKEPVINQLLNYFENDLAETEQYPLLSFEQLFISYFFALKKGEAAEAVDLLKLIKSHPYFKKQDLLLRALLEEDKEGGDDPLGKMRETLFSLKNKSLNDSSFFAIVDENKQEIIRNNSIERGEILVKAICALNKENNLSEADFSNQVFGLFEYDAFIHQKKIHNTLQRLRKIVGPQLTFKIKDGRVFSEGSWNELLVLEVPKFQKKWDLSPSWSRLSHQSDELKSKEKNVEVRPIHSMPSKVTRPELEKILGKSRSATHRLIEKWQKQGLVQKKGKARTTSYELSDFLIKKLTNYGEQSWAQ
jgi:hypothetical protein